MEQDPGRQPLEVGTRQLAGLGPDPWAKESFADDVRELSGVHSRVITLASLRSMKTWPRDDPADAAKDRADLVSLPSEPAGDA